MTRSLTDFKRPPQDNGRGAHGPATSGWTGGEQGLDYWVAELQALGVKWFQILDDNGDSLPLSKTLVAAGIFPVVRILRRDPPPNDSPEPNPGHMNVAEEQTVKKLIDAGVRYFETNNEPNLSAQWKQGAIPADPEEAAKLVALNWLFDARLLLDAGGYPGLPSISAGQEMDLIGALAALGRQDILLEGCWIAVHNYGLNRPLFYPTDNVNQNGAPLAPDQYDLGPLTRWSWWNLEERRVDTLDDVNQIRASEKKVGSTILTDHACFREYEYYASLAQKHLGRPIPIISTEGGYTVGRRQDARYPRITPQMHADLTVATFDFMQRDAPDYFFAHTPWLLLPSAGLEQDAWYGDYWKRAFQEGAPANAPMPPFPVPGVKLGENLPVIPAVKAMPNLQRGAAQPARPTPISIPTAPPPPPPSGEGRVYLVQHGDTLSALAKRFGTTVPALAELNQIGDPSRIFAGQRLVLPDAATSEHPAAVSVGQLPPAVTGPTPASPLEVAPGTSPPKRPMAIPTPPKPRGGDQFDPRLAALNVRVLNAMVLPGFAYWRLVRAEYQDPTQSGSNHHVYYAVLDETGSPVAGQRVFQGWPDDQAETNTDSAGNANIAMWASYSPDQGESGPYSAWVDGLPSDRVTGLGLPLNRHVNFRLTWQKTVR